MANTKLNDFTVNQEVGYVEKRYAKVIAGDCYCDTVFVEIPNEVKIDGECDLYYACYKAAAFFYINRKNYYGKESGAITFDELCGWFKESGKLWDDMTKGEHRAVRKGKADYFELMEKYLPWYQEYEWNSYSDDSITEDEVEKLIDKRDTICIVELEYKGVEVYDFDEKPNGVIIY